MDATKDANVILYYFGVSAVFQLLVIAFGDLGDKVILANDAVDEQQPEEGGEDEPIQTSSQAELSATSRPSHTNGYIAIPTTAEAVDLDERTALEWFCHPRVIVFVFTMTCAGVAFSIMNLYLFLFLKEIGSSDSLAGMVGPVGAVTSLLVFAFSKTVSVTVMVR
jgi:MFS_1 like family